MHKYNLKGELIKPWEEGLYSVTTILAIRHKQKLWEWKLRVGKEESEKRATERADLGTRVHRACEDYVKSTAEPAIDDDVKPFFNGFLNWLDSLPEAPQDILSEEFVYSARHGYAGRVDMIIDLGGKLWIVDIKTGAKSWEHGLQLAAYRQALYEEIKVRCRTACLYLTDKTKKGYQFVEYKDSVKDFLHYKGVFDLQMKYEPIKEPTRWDGGIIYA